MSKFVDNGPMLNAYPDSMGGTMKDIVEVLSREEFKDVFQSFYILPSIFNTDLDRGFSVIDYNIKMATNYPTNRTISYPSCNDGSLNYYRKIGAYFDTYALYRVRNYFKEKFRNNIYEDIEIKFGDKNNYEAFLYDYLEKENAYIFDDVSEVRPLYYGTVRVSYETIEGSCYAKITVSF